MGVQVGKVVSFDGAAALVRILTDCPTGERYVVIRQPDRPDARVELSFV